MLWSFAGRLEEKIQLDSGRRHQGVDPIPTHTLVSVRGSMLPDPREQVKLAVVGQERKFPLHCSTTEAAEVVRRTSSIQARLNEGRERVIVFD